MRFIAIVTVCFAALFHFLEDDARAFADATVHDHHAAFAAAGLE